MSDFLKKYQGLNRDDKNDDDFISFYIRKKRALGEEIPEEYQQAVKMDDATRLNARVQNRLDEEYKKFRARDEKYEQFKINQKIEAQKTDTRNRIEAKSTAEAPNNNTEIERLKARDTQTRSNINLRPTTKRTPIARKEMTSMYNYNEKESNDYNLKAKSVYAGFREQIKRDNFDYFGETYKEMAKRRKEYEDAGYDEVSITNRIVQPSTPNLDNKLNKIAKKLKPGKEGVAYNMVETSYRKQVESMLSNEAVREMNGFPNQLDRVQKWMEEHPELDPEWMKNDLGKVEKLVYGATGGITDMGTLIVQSGLAGIDEAIGYATVGAGMGAMYGGGIASSMTASAGAVLGASFGIRAGAFKYMDMVESGQAYLEYIEKGVDPEIAGVYASGVGAINGLIELALVSGLVGLGGAGSSVLKKAINASYSNTGKGLVGVLSKAGVKVGELKAKHKILNFGTDYLANYGGNIFEEMVQESVTIEGLELSAIYQEAKTGKKIATPSAEENIARVLDTGKQAMITMALFPIGTSLGSSAFNYTGTKIQKSQYQNSQEFKNFTKTLDDESHLAFYENMANKKDALPSKQEYETIKLNINSLKSIKANYKLTNKQQEQANKLVSYMENITNRYQYQAKEENTAITYAFEDFNDMEEELLTTTEINGISSEELGMTLKLSERYRETKQKGYVDEIRELIFQYERNGYLEGIDVNNNNIEEKKIFTVANAMIAKNRKLKITDAYAYARSVIKMEQALKKAKIINKAYNNGRAEEQKDLANIEPTEETEEVVDTDTTETGENSTEEELDTSEEIIDKQGTTEEQKYEKIIQAMKKDITDDTREDFNDNVNNYVRDYLANHADKYNLEGIQADLDELTSRIKDAFNEAKAPGETVDATEAEFDEAMEKVAREEGEVADQNKTYRYYTTSRPPAPGAIPKGFNNVEMYDNKTDGSWGYVEYDKPLSAKQISDYELREEIIEKEETTEIIRPKKPSTEIFDKAFFDDDVEAQKEVNKWEEYLENFKKYVENQTGDTFQMTEGGLEGQYIIVSPSTRENFKYQITVIDKDGVPAMHEDVKEKADIAPKLIELGYDNHEDIEENKVQETTDETTKNAIKPLNNNMNTGDVVRADVDDLNIDSKKYQFRYNAEAKTGSTQNLAGINNWEDELSGIITVRQDEAGDLWVINGHNRVTRMKEFGAEQIVARILSHKDYTETQARAKGALINISEGNATAIDIGKFMRDTGETEQSLIDQNIPPKKLSDGVALSKLHDAIFQAVATKKFNENMAVIIGEGLDNKDLQYQLYNTVNHLREDKGRTITQGALKELIILIKSVPSTEKTQETLLGTETTTESIWVEKSDLMRSVKAQLNSAKKIFKQTSKEKNKERLERIGNTIDVDANKSMASEAEMAIMFLDKTINNRGSAVSNLFTELAEKMVDASTSEKNQLKKEAYNRLMDIIETGEVTKGTMLDNAYQIKENLQLEGDDIEDNNIQNIIKSAQDNPIFNGLKIINSNETKTMRGDELNDNAKGYAEATGKETFNVTGRYTNEGNGRGSILLYKGATTDTILEELIHHVQFNLDEIDSALSREMMKWIADAERMSENLGLRNIPNSFELFAQALVFSEMGYATENEQLANLIALPDALVENFRDVMGKEFYDSAKGKEYSKLSKEERILNVKAGKKSGLALHGTRYSTNHSANNSPLLDNYRYREDESNYDEINSESQWEIINIRNNKSTTLKTHLGQMTGTFDEKVHININDVKKEMDGSIFKDFKETNVYKSRYETVKNQIINDNFNYHDPVNQMVIGVDAFGNAFFLQGEPVYDALKNADYSNIPVSIEYYDGSERIEGGFYPDNIVKISNKIQSAPDVIFDFNESFKTNSGTQQSFGQTAELAENNIKKIKGQQSFLNQLKPIEKHAYIMNGFYSKMIRLIDKKFQGRRFKAMDILALIKKGENGIKEDEIKYSGIEGYLTKRAMDNGYVYMEDLKDKNKVVTVLGLENFLKQNYPNIKVYKKDNSERLSSKDYEFINKIRMESNNEDSSTFRFYDGDSFLTDIPKSSFYPYLLNRIDGYASPKLNESEISFNTRIIPMVSSSTNNTMGFIAEVFYLNKEYKEDRKDMDNTNIAVVESLNNKLLYKFDKQLSNYNTIYDVLLNVRRLQGARADVIGGSTLGTTYFVKENMDRLKRIDEKSTELAIRADVLAQQSKNIDDKGSATMLKYLMEALAKNLHANFGDFEYSESAGNAYYMHPDLVEKPIGYIFKTLHSLQKIINTEMFSIDDRLNADDDRLNLKPEFLESVESLRDDFKQVGLDLIDYLIKPTNDFKGLFPQILESYSIYSKTLDEFAVENNNIIYSSFKDTNVFLDNVARGKDAQVYKTLNYESSGSPKYAEWALDIGTNYREFLFTLPDAFHFKTPHWKKTDIIAHARTKDLKIDGEKYLLIDEIQSDIHGSTVASTRNYRKNVTSEIRGNIDISRDIGSYGNKDEHFLNYDDGNFVSMEATEDLISTYFNDFTGYSGSVEIEDFSGNTKEYEPKNAPIVKINKERYNYFKRLLQENLGATDEQFISFMTDKLKISDPDGKIDLLGLYSKMKIIKMKERWHLSLEVSQENYKNNFWLSNTLRNFMIEKDLYSEERYRSLMDEAERLYTEMNMTALEELHDIANKMSTSPHTKNIPEAPYKSSWQEMVMKQLVNLAVESDYKGLVWTTGKEQAERYGISQHVTSMNLSEVDLVNEERDVKGYSIRDLVFKLQTTNGSVMFYYDSYTSNFYKNDKSLSEYVGEEYAGLILKEIDKKRKLFPELSKRQTEIKDLQELEDKSWDVRHRLTSNINTTLSDAEHFTLIGDGQFYEGTTFTKKEISVIRDVILARPNILPAIHLAMNAERLGLMTKDMEEGLSKYDETGFLVDLSMKLLTDRKIGSENTQIFIDAILKKDAKFEKYLDELQKLGQAEFIRDVTLAVRDRYFRDTSRESMMMLKEIKKEVTSDIEVPQFVANEKGKSTIYDEIMVRNINKLNGKNKWGGTYDSVFLQKNQDKQDEGVSLIEEYPYYKREYYDKYTPGMSDYENFFHRFKLTDEAKDKIKKFGQNLYQAKKIDGELSFPQTLDDMDGLDDKFKKLLRQENWAYDVKTNKQTIVEALYIINEQGENAVINWVIGKQPGDRVMFMAGAMIASLYSNSNATRELSVTLMMRIGEKVKDAGQAVQILASIDKLSPPALSRLLLNTVYSTHTKKQTVDLRTKSQKIIDTIDTINAEGLTKLSIGNWLNDIVKLQPEEMLSKKILATLDANTPEDDPVKIMINTLFKLAKEEAPLEQAESETKDPLEFVVEAINNREKYRETWKLAKRQLEENILKDEPEKLAQLEPFFDMAINRTFPQSRLRQSIKQGLEELEVDIKSIVKQHYTEQSAIRKSLAEKLVYQAGLSEMEAQILEDYIRKEMKQLTKESKEAQLKTIFAEKKPKGQSKTIDQRIIELSNLGAFKNELYKNLVAEKLGFSFVEDDTLDTLHAMAQNLQTIEDKRERDVQSAIMLNLVSEHIKPTIGQKASLVMILAQLLNFKTIGRNLLGNMGMQISENIMNVAAIPVDIFATMVTGFDRTKFLHPKDSVTAQLKGFGEGLKYGYKDARLGIDTSNLSTQFSVPKHKVFRHEKINADDNIIDKTKKVIGGVFSDLEMFLNVALKATDRASYSQAFEEELRELMLMKKVETPTGEMLQYAHRKGLYRTFQDSNKISDTAVDFKKLLNFGFNFGAGNFIINYPKTPANLLARGMDYSLIGVVNQMIKFTVASKKGEATIYDKKALVESTARGVTGSVAIGMGMILARAGVITSSPDEEEPYRTSNFKRQVNLRDYSINVDALGRWVDSGFRATHLEVKEGDKLVSYDWYQPSAISFAMGADMYREEQALDLGLNLVSNLASASSTLTQQPLLQGVSKFFGARSSEEAMETFLTGIFSSFTPTLFSQMAYMIDPTVRNPKERGKVLQTSFNRAIKKIPFLSKTLPAYYDGFGDKAEYDFGSNLFEGLDDTFGIRFFNNFFAPAITGEFNPTIEEEKVLELIRLTGEQGHIPERFDDKWTIQTWENNEKTPKEVILNAEEYAELSEWAGLQAKEKYRQEITQYGIGTLPAEEQVKILAGILGDIRSDVRIKLAEMRGYEPY